MGAPRNKIAKAIGYFFATFCVVVASIFCLILFYAILNGGGNSVSPMNACINNLRMIDAAKQQWALENKESSGAMPTWKDINSYLEHDPNSQQMSGPLRCPSGGTYTIGTISNLPTCTIPGHALSP